MSYQGLSRPRPVFNARPPMPVVPFTRVGRDTKTAVGMVALRDLTARFRLVCQQQPERAGRPAILVMPRLKPVSTDEPEPALMVIADAVSETFGVPLRDLMADRRTRTMTLPRHAMFWLARELTHHSLPLIGRAYRRDHSSIMHGIANCETWMALDPAYRDAVLGIMVNLGRQWELPQEVRATLERFGEIA